MTTAPCARCRSVGWVGIAGLCPACMHLPVPPHPSMVGDFAEWERELQADRVAAANAAVDRVLAGTLNDLQRQSATMAEVRRQERARAAARVAEPWWLRLWRWWSVGTRAHRRKP